MTQALINSLKILSEMQPNLTDKMSKNAGMDFGKIFEIKTDDMSQNAKNVQQYAEKNQMSKTANNWYKMPEKTNYEQKQNQNKTIQNQNTEFNNDNKNINNGPVKDENVQSEDEKLILNGYVEENSKNEEQETEDAVSVAENAIILIEDEELITNITEETEETEDNQETTITDEDSTMYKELITLENPTAFIMLQTQVSQTVKQALQTEQTDIAEQNVNIRTNTQLLNENDNAEAAVLKQFEVAATKDTVFVNSVTKKTANSVSDKDRLSNVINKNMLKEMNVQVINAQSAESESSMGDLMQNQTPQEQTARIMIQGDMKYESVAAETLKNVSQTKTVNINPSKIIDQITKQLDGMVNNSKINLVLNPGTLGKLNLQLMNTKEGLIAQFTAATTEARDILMKGLEGLKESLLAQGINVDNVSVRLEETDGEYKQDYTEQEGSKGGNKHQGAKKQKEDEKNFEEMMFEQENNGNV